MVTVRRRTHLGKDCGHGLKKTNDDCCKKTETWSLLSKLDSPTRHRVRFAVPRNLTLPSLVVNEKQRPFRTAL